MARAGTRTFDHDAERVLVTGATGQVGSWVVDHLAAIADPQDNPGTDVFENNVQSTYHVLEAAGRHDCDVVLTSSQAVYGALFATEPWTPAHLPIDETTRAPLPTLRALEAVQ